MKAEGNFSLGRKMIPELASIQKDEVLLYEA